MLYKNNGQENGSYFLGLKVSGFGMGVLGF